MLIDKTGSNIAPFSHLFLYGKEQLFRHAISSSFSFASYTVKFAKQAVPDHKLEVWDQAVQYKFAKINYSERFFINDVTLYLEKYNSGIVWQYGISITESQRHSKQRLWTLPDGIIKTSNQVIAIEFDHGGNLGNWVNQLFKAVRSLASSRIDGLLYCFCLEKDLHPSGYLLAADEDFTTEFHSLLRVGLSGKSLGIVTISPREWQSLTNTNNKRELVDFFENVYVFNDKMSAKSRRVAQNILTELQKVF